MDVALTLSDETAGTVWVHAGWVCVKAMRGSVDTAVLYQGILEHVTPIGIAAGACREGFWGAGCALSHAVSTVNGVGVYPTRSLSGVPRVKPMRV